MPVYNAEQYLRPAVESILAQTFGDFEFLIMDDGSRDSSIALVKEYAAKDPRVKLVERQHTGLNQTLNDGLKMARGKYLARMDADDISMPTRFEKQIEYLESHPDCVLLGSRVMLIDTYGSPFSESFQKLTHEEIDAELLRGSGWALVHPSTMMRREVLMAAGGYNPRCYVCEDHDLYLRMAERGRVANLPEILLWYRRHYGSINHTQYEEQYKIKQSIVAEAYQRRGQPMPKDWSFKRWVPPPLSVQLRQWGWAALRVGNVPVARRHAVSAFKKAPLSLDSWRLMFCAVRGR
jgi:glycosyltransferase involved in cell wall biosynthesis